MSYILDALLKADRERQRQSTPSLYSSHVATVARPERPLRLWAALGFTAMLGLLAAGNYLYRQPPPLPAPIRPAIAPAQPKPATAVMPKPQDTVAHKPAEQPRTDSHTATAPPQATTPRVTPPRVATAASKARTPPPAIAAPKAKAAGSAANEPAAIPPKPDSIIDFGGLPLALRREVESNVVISGLSLTPDNGEHLAIINDRARHAGDEVLPGMTLESVQPDGIVLRYKGYRFRRGLN